MEHQNWDYTVYDKSHKNEGFQNQKQINKAGQQGMEIEAQKKASATNKHGQLTGTQIFKAMESEDLEVPTISLDFKIALMQARQAKKLTQKDLAMKINETQSLINDYEAGRAIPNPQVINKLDKALGVHLPRDKKKKKKESQDDI